MTRPPFLPLPALLLILLAGCTANRQQAFLADMEKMEASERAEAACQELGVSLMGELANALGAGTPESAIGVCAEVAQRITAEVSAEMDLTVRRTALRVRNPTNAPDAWERKILEGWSEVADPKTITPAVEVVETESGWVFRQMRPIVLQDLCTQCHGQRDAMSQPLRDALAERYPEDTAVGFAPGELRGAFSVAVSISGE